METTVSAAAGIDDIVLFVRGWLDAFVAGASASGDARTNLKH